MEQESFLSELEFIPVRASTGKRFLNYLIDLIGFYFLFIVFGVAAEISSPGTLAAVNGNGCAVKTLIFKLPCTHKVNGNTDDRLYGLPGRSSD